MKIAYDGKRAIRNFTGLGNYSRLVIETMSEAYPSDDFLVYTPDMRPNDRLDTILGRDNVVMRMPDRYWVLPKAAWRSWGVTTQARKEGVELYHGLSNELPFNIFRSPIASVVTIHDVIYRRMPECYKPIDRQIYDFKYGFAARHADRVIAISEATRRDVMELYGVPENRIDVIYQGCSPLFNRDVSLDERRSLREKLHLPPRYLIQVGSIEKRKNLELSLRALSALPDDIHLVAVGAGKAYLKEMRALASELGVGKRLHIKEKIPFSQLPALYQMSLASLYPSHYEGFGIPVLEALTCGVPTVTSTTSSLPEAGGNAAFLVHPTDVKEMVAAINAILAGGPEIETRRRQGRVHAARFSAHDIAPRIYQTYLKAIQHHSKNR